MNVRLTLASFRTTSKLNNKMYPENTKTSVTTTTQRNHENPILDLNNLLAKNTKNSTFSSMLSFGWLSTVRWGGASLIGRTVGGAPHRTVDSRPDDKTDLEAA